MVRDVDNIDWTMDKSSSSRLGIESHIARLGKMFARYARTHLTGHRRTHSAMSSTSNTSKPDENASKAPEKPKSEDIQHLGVLEEDDEFEEFECAGECRLTVGRVRAETTVPMTGQTGTIRRRTLHI